MRNGRWRVLPMRTLTREVIMNPWVSEKRISFGAWIDQGASSTVNCRVTGPPTAFTPDCCFLGGEAPLEAPLGGVVAKNLLDRGVTDGIHSQVLWVLIKKIRRTMLKLVLRTKSQAADTWPNLQTSTSKDITPCCSCMQRCHNCWSIEWHARIWCVSSRITCRRQHWKMYNKTARWILHTVWRTEMLDRHQWLSYLASQT